MFGITPDCLISPVISSQDADNQAWLGLSLLLTVLLLRKKKLSSDLAEVARHESVDEGGLADPRVPRHQHRHRVQHGSACLTLVT